MIEFWSVEPQLIKKSQFGPKSADGNIFDKSTKQCSSFKIISFKFWNFWKCSMSGPSSAASDLKSGHVELINLVVGTDLEQPEMETEERGAQ